MKYVIVKDQFGDEVAILFDEMLDHSRVAHNAIAAGFCTINQVDTNTDYEPDVTCYGNSVTLGCGSRGTRDRLLIVKALSMKL